MSRIGLETMTPEERDLLLYGVTWQRVLPSGERIRVPPSRVYASKKPKGNEIRLSDLLEQVNRPLRIATGAMSSGGGSR